MGAPRNVAARAMAGRARVIVALSLCACLAGCALRRPLPRAEAPARLPAAADLESALAQRRDALHGLRALARMRYRDGEESGSSRQVIVLERPDRLRVEVLSILGTVFVMTADRQTFSAYATDEGTVYRGTPSRTLMGRYARVALGVNELIDLLLASPAAAPSGGRGDVSFDDDPGAIRLLHTDAIGSNSVWFSASYAPIAAERRDADGEIEWRAEFDGYEDHDGLHVATKVKLEFPPTQRRIELTLQNPEVNPPFDDSIFALQAPLGTKVVDLDRGVP